MYYLLFYTNVARIMDEKGITGNALGELSGVSPSLLSLILSGKGNPTLETMEAIARVLDVPLPELIMKSDLPEELVCEITDTAPIGALPKGFQRVLATVDYVDAFRIKEMEKKALVKISALANEEEYVRKKTKNGKTSAT